jgi:hypothetical protein
MSEYSSFLPNSVSTVPLQMNERRGCGCYAPGAAPWLSHNCDILLI